MGQQGDAGDGRDVPRAREGEQWWVVGYSHADVSSFNVLSKGLCYRRATTEVACFSVSRVAAAAVTLV